MNFVLSVRKGRPDKNRKKSSTATLQVSGLPTEDGFGVRLGCTRIPWEEKEDLDIRIEVKDHYCKRM